MAESKWETGVKPLLVGFTTSFIAGSRRAHLRVDFDIRYCSTGSRLCFSLVVHRCHLSYKKNRWMMNPTSWNPGDFMRNPILMEHDPPYDRLIAGSVLPYVPQTTSVFHCSLGMFPLLTMAVSRCLLRRFTFWLHGCKSEDPTIILTLTHIALTSRKSENHNKTTFHHWRRELDIFLGYKCKGDIPPS